MSHNSPSCTSIQIGDYEIDATFSEVRNPQVYQHVKQILLASFANNAGGVAV